ncbi:phytoene desaturase [Paenibacillus sp. IB182496]|uniref:4,4'-diaponeurosporene oxygenase n=2 Tax=Paenibacillus sabuli TaxID=2772509 RepID=A0A927GTR0_9BACL|nr:phytoene desaturase [Paenibacillus sabuli]
MKQVVVIGGGLGGLSAAIRLAAAGCRVMLLEQHDALGGKLQRVQMGAYRFDRGPSTITMIAAFERVFAAAGRQMADYLELYRLTPAARNVFADGSMVDLSADASAMEAQIAVYSPQDAQRYRAFMAESERLYRLAEGHFLHRLLLTPRDKADPRLLGALLRVRPLLSLDRLLRRYFRHPNTLAMLGRYATYVGSDPRRAPAVFGMLPHLEAALGVYGVRGGTYAIVEAFRRLAVELGVTIRTGVRVTRILSASGRVRGVRTAEGEHAEEGAYAAEVVVAGGDVLSISGELLTEAERPRLRDARIARYEPSLSGFVLLAGIRRTYPQLLHHTVFFPARYGSEFDDIFNHRRAPDDPAVYICHSGHSEPGMAPAGGSNLFILVNAPYTSPDWNWAERAPAYRGRILQRLSELGVDGLADGAEVEATYTPEQLRRETSAYRGAIYGISSNSARQTFARPSNRGDLRGLWFVGGTTHPGGGTPLVALSGQLVAEAILKEG